MKRILYIQPYASHVGGVDSVLLQLIAGLDKSSYKTYVLLPGPSPYVEKYERLGTEVLYGKLAVFGKPTDWAYYIRNMWNLVVSIGLIRRLIKDHSIDLVHSHKMELIGGNIAGKLSGIPTLQTIHELPRRPLAAYKFIGLVDHLFNDKLIVLCERSKIMFQWRHVKSSKLTKIYNGIEAKGDVEALAAGAGIREELGLSSEDKLAITVARLAPMKGIEYLIKAAVLTKQEDSAIKYIVVGDVAFDQDIAYRDSLFEMRRSLGLEDTVYFLGLRRDVPDLMRQADVFVLPSAYDIFPTVLLEAMSAGLPVVATDVGGVPEMVKEDAGILVPPLDESALNEAVRKVLAGDPSQLGRNGKAYFLEHLTSEKYVAATTAVYEELLRRTI